MKRVTLRIPEAQLEEIEEQVERGRFPNRSEAIRTAVRELLEEHDGPRTYSAPRGVHQERDPRDLRTDGGLGISAAELEKRKQSHSSTPGEQRRRCPTCGTLKIVRKVKRNNQEWKEGRYRCTRVECGDHFDDPATGYETREAFLEDQEDPEIVSDGGQVLACPECDATEISHRNGRGERALARTWHCHICLADFKEPNRRPPKTPGGTVSIPGGTGAAALAKMDPDDLVTDGGTDHYPEGVECPNCGAPVGEPCKHTDSEGRTGIPTVVPHKVRDELARELAADGGRDISMELIEKAEEFDELQDAMLERGDDDARVAADICDDVREICLRLADVLERREKVRDRFRVDDDEVLTDGGISVDNIQIHTWDTSHERWSERAEANLDRWGEQPPVELVLAIIEEVGEVADEVIETGRFDNAEAKHARVCLSAARDSGFATRSFLESFYEDDAGKPLPLDERPELDIDVDADAVQDELDDLAPLLYQLAWALEEADL